MTTLPMKEIPSAPGYLARGDGRIFSVLGRELRQSPVKGYPRVTTKRKGRYVHALVCEAFHGPKPSPSHQVAHNDGVKTHNVPCNLRWATPFENQQDQIAHGTRQIGEKNPRAILTEDDVAEIKRSYAAAMGARYVRRGTRQQLAARFGVNLSVIKDVVSGRSWRHVIIDLPFLPPPAATH